MVMSLTIEEIIMVIKIVRKKQEITHTHTHTEPEWGKNTGKVYIAF